jgi:hypothetical protein
MKAREEAVAEEHAAEMRSQLALQRADHEGQVPRRTASESVCREGTALPEGMWDGGSSGRAAAAVGVRSQGLPFRVESAARCCWAGASSAPAAGALGRGAERWGSYATAAPDCRPAPVDSEGVPFCRPAPAMRPR